jgi:hypothetical protein
VSVTDLLLVVHLTNYLDARRVSTLDLSSGNIGKIVLPAGLRRLCDEGTLKSAWRPSSQLIKFCLIDLLQEFQGVSLRPR